MADLLKVTIDGREALVPKGSLIVDAAKQVGVDIPVFCYHGKLTPVGACRMCLVEIEKVPKLQTACTTPVADGMVVRTDTPQVDKARKGVLEFLLTNHPLDCPVCDKGGECPLQDTTFKYACDRSRFGERQEHFEKALRLSDRIVLDRERCVMCMRCVRFHREVVGDEAITLLNRGARSMVGTLPGRRFDSPFSGNTTELCPVGALTSARFRFRARSWELTKTPGICTLCPVGCNIMAETRNGEVLRLTSRENPAVDDGWLCDWGRFTYDFVNDPSRLPTPLVRRDGELVAATWREALEAITFGLRGAAAEGGQAVGGLISPNATNEELFLFQKLFRSVLKSENVDHGLHGEYSLPDHGVDAPSATIASLDSAGVIVVAGADVISKQPVLFLRIRKAVRRGAKLLVVSSKPGSLSRLGAWLRVKQGGEAAVIKGLVRAILSDETAGPLARERLQGSYERVAQGVSGYGAQVVSDVSAADAAGLEKAVELLAATTGVVVLYPRPVPGSPEGLREGCEWLGTVTGGRSDPSGGVLPLGIGGNSQGALDMGVLPNVGPGQVKSVAGAGGLSGVEMLKAAADGSLKAMYLVGVDPATGADAEAAGEALSKLPFLVVQDLFLSATARLADVVLPSASFAEKDGTMTNLERRVQKLNQAVPLKAEARQDWEIISAIATALGADWGFSSASDVFAEVATTVSGYAGLAFDRLGAEGTLCGQATATVALEASNGHERKLWYQPLVRETEPQVTGA